MITLTDEQKKNLKILHLIFHVVQHEDDEPILLDETPIKGFENFFLSLVRDNLKGSHFEFLPGSSTLKLLEEISLDAKKFVENSKQLAINFHAQRDGRIKPGAIILIKLQVETREFYSILKYDREQVIAYDVVGDTRAILQEIVNSFTSSKDALQKSAMIELLPNGGELIVNDRTVSYDITDFFRGFLNVRRIKREEELTKIVHDIILKTSSKHSVELPSELTGNIRDITFRAIQKLDAFNEEEFFHKVFGGHGTDKILITYRKLLQKEGVDGDTFRFVKDAIKPPKEKKYRTNEGVKISIAPGAENTVNINREKTIITIRTNKLIEE